MFESDYGNIVTILQEDYLDRIDFCYLGWIVNEPNEVHEIILDRLSDTIEYV